MEFIFPVIGGLFLFLVIGAFVSAPGQTLNKKFVKLGILKGKTYRQIVNACGKPNAISSLPNGKRLCQWQAAGYHIALIFNENDICEGVSSEISV